jgi:phospholipid/cholesterol/gamma-HCH transport system substrate-binding protein
MASPTNYWKLGLFVVLALALGFAAVAYFGTAAVRRNTVEYRTYFDESVQGLEVTSAVRFRGILVGRVSDITIAPDRRHVEVACGLVTKDLRRLGLAVQGDGGIRLAMGPGLRAQLAPEGVTGVQALELDYFDPATHPPPELPFAVPDRYIPSTESTLGLVADAAVKTAAEVPGLVGGAGALVRQIADAKLGEQAAATLHHADEALAGARRVIDRVGSARVPEEAAQSLAALSAAFEQLDRLLGRLEGPGGLARSAQRATDAVGDIAADARGMGGDLTGALRDLRDMSASVRRLTDELDRQPDLLLKGRGKARAP